MTTHLIRANDLANAPEYRVQHQFNEQAIRLTRTLSTPTGMQRLGLHLVRVKSGLDSTTHHSHDADEEFIFVLSGRGIARIGEEEFAVGPGDFMGFPERSPAHSMRNCSDEDLVYLMGGESNPVDVVHYPDLSRSMIKSHGKRTFADWSDLSDVDKR